jgi:hypothetical protein
MIMIDVRNAIANILDRYSLGDVVTVTMRKMERDGLAPTTTPTGICAARTSARISSWRIITSCSSNS